MAGDFTSSYTPPLPPPSEDDRLLWLRLLRSRRVGVATFFRLMNEHGTAAKALESLPDVARSAGVNGYQACPEHLARAEMAAARKIGAHMLCIGAADYPPALLDLPDPPPILWALGQVDLLQRPMVAMVGARNASSLGGRMARHLSADLGAAGLVVVSGLARGIDAAAHDAALRTGTVAVLGGGVDVIYPNENTGIYHEIARNGVILSEQPIGLKPQARHFPRRNRIISGLASAVVVIEAAAKSGSLITARNALDQGRDVLAVPGHPMDARASGCNMLIRDGATLIRNADDVLEAIAQPTLPLPPMQQTTKPPKPKPATPAKPTAKAQPRPGNLPDLILAQLGPTPVPEDQIIRDLGRPAHEVTTALIDLELSGEITRHPGGLLSRS